MKTKIHQQFLRKLSFSIFAVTSTITISFAQCVTLTCPTNLSLNTDLDSCSAVATFAASATYACNLVTNGGAELNNLSGWTLSNGGSGWAVSGEFHSGTNSFIGSYSMGTMSQTIDLIANGYTSTYLDNSPSIYVSEWYKANTCCSTIDKYFFKAELLNASSTVIGTFNLGTQSSPVNATSSWQQVTNTFSGYPAGVRFVRITHGSADQEFWSGNYGAVIDDATVIVEGYPGSITYNPPSDGSFPIGTTTVTVTTDAGNGNTDSCTFDVTVSDNQGPTAPILNDTSSLCAIALIAPIASDNCAGPITGTTTDPTSYNSPGSYIVNWAFDDGNGNVSTAVQNVTVTSINTSTTLNGTTISATNTTGTYQWIDCSNNAFLVSQTSQSFTASQNGSYAVIITEGNCVDTSACTTITTVSTTLVAENSILEVYPNPSSGLVTIATNTDLQLHVTNAEGKIISVQKMKIGENTVNLSTIENGVYFLILNDVKNNSVTKRISILK